MFGLVGVAVAIAAPAALAGHQDLGTKAALEQVQGMRHNQRAGTLGIRRANAAGEPPDAIERYLRNNPRQDRPGDRAGTRGIGEQTVAVDTSDVVSRYLRSNPAPDRTAIGGAGTTGPAIDVPVASPGAFNWRDAGIGAGSALGLMLIAVGGVGVALHRKPSRTTMLSS
jgi:hypothetical protein